MQRVEVTTTRRRWLHLSMEDIKEVTKLAGSVHREAREEGPKCPTNTEEK